MISVSSIVFSDFPSACYFVITSLLEQAPDWLWRRKISPKFRFFNSRVSRVKTPETLNSRRLIRAKRAAGCLFASLHWLNVEITRARRSIRVWCERTINHDEQARLSYRCCLTVASSSKSCRNKPRALSVSCTNCQKARHLYFLQSTPSAIYFWALYLLLGHHPQAS